MLREDFAIDALRRCVLFRNAEEPGLRVVARSLRYRNFRRNEVIFHQGDLGNSLQIVASGAVKIVLPSLNGEEAIIATLRPGDFFGELALLDNAPHSATATALEPTETLDLPRPAFEEMLERDPSLMRALLTGLAGELRRLTGHVEELHFLDLAGRLVARLVHIAHDEYPGATGPIELAWPYTQSDLAAMIGGTRQSVNRLLTALVEDDLVRIDHDVLQIPDLTALEMRIGR